jgi:hypothetical protein
VYEAIDWNKTIFLFLFFLQILRFSLSTIFGLSFGINKT